MYIMLSIPAAKKNGGLIILSPGAIQTVHLAEEHLCCQVPQDKPEHAIS